MSQKIYPVPDDWKTRARIDEETYRRLYERSIKDPDGFWAEQAQRIDWITPFSKVKRTSFDTHNVSIRWFEDGTTNVAMNCIDRHLPERANKTAIIWEGDDPSVSRHITYAELHEEVCRFANVLKKHGVKKGDRVTIYLPMIPEAAFAMLACARIGADPFGGLRRLLAGFARRDASRTRNQRSSSRRTKACAAARRFR